MRLGLISDLHAMLCALDAVLAELDRLGVDRIVCLGDIVDLGPSPVRVVERLRERGIACIRGNHDPLDEHPALPLLNEVEAWTRDRLGPLADELLALPPELELDLDGATVLCVHGSPRSATDQVLDHTPWETLEAWCAGRSFDVLACGHTHVQALRRRDGRTYVNAGSVGQPFERPGPPGPPRVLRCSDFAVLEGRGGVVSAALRRVPLDWRAFESEVRDSGFPHPDEWLSHWVSG